MGRRHLLVSPLATSLCTAGVLPIQGRHSRKSVESVEHTATLFLAIKTKTMRAYHLRILKTQDFSRLLKTVKTPDHRAYALGFLITASGS